MHFAIPASRAVSCAFWAIHHHQIPCFFLQKAFLANEKLGQRNAGVHFAIPASLAISCAFWAIHHHQIPCFLPFLFIPFHENAPYPFWATRQWHSLSINMTKNNKITSFIPKIPKKKNKIGSFHFLSTKLSFPSKHRTKPRADTSLIEQSAIRSCGPLSVAFSAVMFGADMFTCGWMWLVYGVPRFAPPRFAPR